MFIKMQCIFLSLSLSSLLAHDCVVEKENYIFILMLQHIFKWYQKNNNNRREIGENMLCNIRRENFK